MKRVYLFLALVFLSWGAYAQLNFQETMSYINNDLERIKHSYREKDIDHWIKQKTKIVENSYSYSLEHKHNCQFLIHSKLETRTKAFEVTYLFDITKIPNIYYEKIYPIEDMTIRKNIPNNMVSFNLGLSKEELNNFFNEAKHNESYKVIKREHVGEASWFAGFSLQLETQDKAQRLAKAFQNLKETCTKDSFA